MGAPAKVVRAVTEAERERMRSGLAHYLTYAREYRANIMAAVRREPGHGGAREL